MSVARTRLSVLVSAGTFFYVESRDEADLSLAHEITDGP